MPQWECSSKVACWAKWEEQLAPNVWLFMCKRPTGFDWLSNKRAYIWWAHVYVSNGPLEVRYRKELEHYRLDSEDPLLLRCIELEMREKYTNTP